MDRQFLTETRRLLRSPAREPALGPASPPVHLPRPSARSAKRPPRCRPGPPVVPSTSLRRPCLPHSSALCHVCAVVGRHAEQVMREWYLRRRRSTENRVLTIVTTPVQVRILFISRPSFLPPSLSPALGFSPIQTFATYFAQQVCPMRDSIAALNSDERTDEQSFEPSGPVDCAPRSLRQCGALDVSLGDDASSLIYEHGL
ncbi:hypothetical protein C8F04DRAFT_1390238 [Mycena alexandri]|uniref:Uncharacterized protein n=1 Tax=Mycena alexandri TaxID=1745969 RepID=A0AAD6TAD6_9AGAR|nr:hypothetical protein C8F04DRAFT_1390238 [Mycena alexandri]